MTSGMSTVESVDLSGVSSDGEVGRSLTGKRSIREVRAAAAPPAGSPKGSSPAGTPEPGTPRAGFGQEDFETLRGLVSELGKLDRQLAGSKKTSPSGSIGAAAEVVVDHADGDWGLQLAIFNLKFFN